MPRYSAWRALDKALALHFFIEANPEGAKRP